MKIIKHLKMSWFLGAMIVAIAVAEFVAWQVAQVFNVRFEPVLAGTLAVLAVAVFVSVSYEGTE
jgi:hypothetical protein